MPHSRTAKQPHYCIDRQSYNSIIKQPDALLHCYIVARLCVVFVAHCAVAALLCCTAMWQQCVYVDVWRSKVALLDGFYPRARSCLVTNANETSKRQYALKMIIPFLSFFTYQPHISTCASSKMFPFVFVHSLQMQVFA